MMKLSSLLISMLVISTPVYSAVDYSYCQKQFNHFIQSDKPCKESFNGFSTCMSFGEKKEGSSYYPFELKADGTIKAHPSLNYQNIDGVEKIFSTNKEMDYETIITRNEKGEVIDITTSYTMKNKFVGGGSYGVGADYPVTMPKSVPAKFTRKNDSIVKMEIKNGKCIPSRMETLNSLGDESKQEITFDAKLCRNIGQFFKKNPEAASCFDKDLMAKAQGIFQDYYKDNTDVYGPVNVDDPFSRPTPLKTKLKSESSGAYGYPGTGMYGNVGIGMGMGMPGATTEQLLTGMMPSIDTVISSAGFTGFSGFGNSPVVQAMQLQSLCQGGGFDMLTPRDFLTDESVWRSEAPASSLEEAKTIVK